MTVNLVKPMFRSIYLCLFLSSSSSAIAASIFEDVRFITGVSAGTSLTSFDERLDQDISLINVNFLLAASKGKWQISANTFLSISDSNISEEEEIGTASRSDFDLTVGYKITSHWSLFTGYKIGETELVFVPRDPDEAEQPLGFDEQYSENGFYFGGGYSWPFEKAGTLSFTIAYANFSSINDFKANRDDGEEDDEPPEFDDLTGRVEGDVKGLSYSLTWSMPLSGSLIFQTKFKVNDYKKDITVENLTFNNLDDTFKSLSVGLAYVF